ncbi:MAG: ABC transporter ATP-binding protein [Casimicrobium sp.]
MHCIEARGLTKKFGNTLALNNVDLTVAPGRIVGLIGPNGAGKTTLLKAILGLTSFDGELTVLGRNPRTERDVLMRDVSFIADVSVLPTWLRVSQAIDYVEGVHPRFNRATIDAFLAKTSIKRTAKIGELSKGMVTQLHLALVMSIEAKLMVLDEPTLGLDVIYRKQFYESLLNDYYDQERTILITTHQIDEVQHVLTDVMFVDGGRVVFSYEADEFESRFFELSAMPSAVNAARALRPIYERTSFGRSVFLFRDVDAETLVALGEIRTPSVEDVFLAVVGNQGDNIQGAQP